MHGQNHFKLSAVSIGILFYPHTCTSLTEFALLVHLCMYLPDDDIVEAETCRKDILNYEWLFIVDWTVYCITCCKITLFHGTRKTWISCLKCSEGYTQFICNRFSGGELSWGGWCTGG